MLAELTCSSCMLASRDRLELGTSNQRTFELTAYHKDLQVILGVTFGSIQALPISAPSRLVHPNTPAINLDPRACWHGAAFCANEKTDCCVADNCVEPNLEWILHVLVVSKSVLVSSERSRGIEKHKLARRLREPFGSANDQSYAYNRAVLLTCYRYL
jgi:hypothetical protein